MKYQISYSTSLSLQPSCGIEPQLGVKKLNWSRYRPGVAQRVGRGIALLFHDRGIRRRGVSTTPRTLFTPWNDPVPIVQEAGWAPGPVWTGGKSCPHRDLIPDRPVRSQSLYRLSYPAHQLGGTFGNSLFLISLSVVIREYIVWFIKILHK